MLKELIILQKRTLRYLQP